MLVIAATFWKLAIENVVLQLQQVDEMKLSILNFYVKHIQNIYMKAFKNVILISKNSRKGPFLHNK